MSGGKAGQKGLTASFNWHDVWRAEHAAAFSAAKMTDMDLLADSRAAVEKALANGSTFERFKQGLPVPYADGAKVRGVLA